MSRDQYLDSISEIVLPNGHVTRKLDFLGTVRIYNQYYFNVYRRYNNVYEIVLEDFAGDYHFHRDYTVRESLQKVLCLSDEQIHGLHTINAVSFKHRAVISEEVVDMRWTEVEHRWYALDMNLGGILKDFHEQTPAVTIPESPLLTTMPVAPPAPRASRQSSHRTSITPMNLSDRFAEVESLQANTTVLRNGTVIRK